MAREQQHQRGETLLCHNEIEVTFHLSVLAVSAA